MLTVRVAFDVGYRGAAWIVKLRALQICALAALVAAVVLLLTRSGAAAAGVLLAGWLTVVVSLVAHELGHAFAYQRLTGCTDWSLVSRGAAFAVVTGHVEGLGRSVVAVSGPLLGALAALGLGTVAGGYLGWLCAGFHLTCLLPVCADGRHVLVGLAQWADRDATPSI